MHTVFFKLFPQLNATDKDLGKNGVVEYRLETMDSPFVINKSDIVLKYPINETFKNTYELFLCAEDQSDVLTDRR